MYLLLLNSMCRKCFKLWFDSNIRYCWKMPSGRVRKEGKVDRSHETWSKLWLLLMRCSYGPIMASRLFVCYVVWISCYTWKRSGDRLTRGTASSVTAYGLDYSWLRPSSQSWDGQDCGLRLSQLLFQMPYFACTSLNEIRLLLNLLFLILFVPISSWCLQGKGFLSILTKRLNQIDSAIEKGTLNLEGLNKLQKCWDFFSPWKLHAWTIPKLLGLPW